MRMLLLGAFGGIVALLSLVFADAFLNLGAQEWFDFSLPRDYIPIAAAGIGGFLLQVLTTYLHPQTGYGVGFGNNRQILTRVFWATVVLGGVIFLGFRFLGALGIILAAGVSLAIYPWRA